MVPPRHPQDRRTDAPPASSASQTITTPETAHPPGPQATLRLRGVHPPRRRIQWAEDVVDNEGMGKKSSKVCCIYHAPGSVESGSSSDTDSTSSSSSSDSDSDGGPEANHDDGRARMGGKGKERRGQGEVRGRAHHPQEHHGQDACNTDGHEYPHEHPHEHGRPGKVKKAKRVNAYEKVPKGQGKGPGSVVETSG